MSETNWIPGIIVGLTGIVMAVIMLLANRGKGHTHAPNATLLDLDQRVQLLLEQLRTLESDRHHLGEPAYLKEKARLEADAAAALRARDEYRKANPAALQHPASAPAAPATAAGASAPRADAKGGQGFLAKNPQLRGALWGAGIVVFFVAMGFVLSNAIRDRGDGEATGMTPPNDPVPPAEAVRPEDDPMFKAAWDRAKSNPEDTENSAAVVHELIRMQRFDDADELTRKALASDPFHIESRIHAEVLRATKGMFREAMENLGNLAKTYPDAHEALLFRGALAMEVGESRVALESFERFMQQAPPQERPPQLNQTIAMLKQRVRPFPAAPATP